MSLKNGIDIHVEFLNGKHNRSKNRKIDSIQIQLNSQ